MLNTPEKFIQTNSPDGGFLQSEEWRRFQESVGRKTYNISADGFWANIIEHILPVVGKYFYVPRGPILEISNFKFKISNKAQNPNDKISKQTQELINLAKKENAGWVRIDPTGEDALKAIRAWTSGVHNAFGHPMSIAKAPHDMQPKEVFIIDITKSEEEILAQMKSKTRYNVRLAEKKGVRISNIQYPISNKTQNPNVQKENEKYIEEFLRLVKVTAKRDGITAHPGSYYRKMLEIIPGRILKLYVAEYNNKVIAANLVLFYGETATYMHGASDNEHRNVMAPFLLQWRQMQDAKKNGCMRYDFGGVKIVKSEKLKVKSDGNSWNGITRFKTGFSPSTASTIFPGSYDVVINAKKYYLYRLIQKIKALAK